MKARQHKRSSHRPLLVVFAYGDFPEGGGWSWVVKHTEDDEVAERRARIAMIQELTSDGHDAEVAADMVNESELIGVYDIRSLLEEAA